MTAKGGTSPVSSKDHFKYGKPAVTGVSPATGPLAGGTEVTISGSGFAPGASVSFGPAAATNVSVSAARSADSVSYTSSLTRSSPARRR